MFLSRAYTRDTNTNRSNETLGAMITINGVHDQWDQWGQINGVRVIDLTSQAG